MLETQFVPQAEVEQQTPPTPADDPNITGIELDMKELAQMPKAALLASLRNCSRLMARGFSGKRTS